VRFPARIPLGWLLCGAILVSALIALNRGIDLLWGMTLLLTVATAIGFVLPRLQVHGMHVERAQFPESGTVGEPLMLSYRVRASGWFARFGIELHDVFSSTGPTAYLPRVSRESEVEFSFIPRTRGCWALHDLAIESRYPLGLSRARRSIVQTASKGVPKELVIYPSSTAMHWFPVTGEANPHAELRSTRLRGGQDEFFSVRAHRPEDPLRAIHWRASARAGELVVKEHERQTNQQVWIVLELSEDEHVGSESASTFEYMVHIAHSAAIKAREQSIPFGLIYDSGEKIERIGPGLDRGTYLQLRETLARVNPRSQAALTSHLDRLWEAVPGGGTWLLFTPRDPNGRAALLRGARQRAAYPLYVEFDHDSFLRGERRQRLSTQTSAHGLVSIVPYGSDLSELFRT
jgi:uncharacterized protein (DUF58 family)